MKQWQSDPLQGLTVYNVHNADKTISRKTPSLPLKHASQTITRSYRQIIENLKPKEPTGNGLLQSDDAAELLRRFK